MQEQVNLTNRKSLIRLGFAIISVLVIANLFLLKKNLQQIREEADNQVMGVSSSSCSDGCLNLMPKKVYIPLGSETIKAFDGWEDTGAQAYIDLADYPNYRSVNWETSFKIPTNNGEAYARLINVSDSVEIWGSEITSQGDAFQFVSSAPITLWQGNKLYRVQLKSSMGAEVNMEGARIVVTLR